MKTGFKITNDIRNMKCVQQLLDYFKTHKQYYLESGFYFEENEMNGLFTEYLKDEYNRVNMHASRRNSVFSLPIGDGPILEDLALADKLNALYTVIHLTPGREYDDLIERDVKIAKGIQYLRILNYLAEKHQHAFYLENTYHDINFYTDLFNGVLYYNMKNIHFCFDMGHAKVWSGNTFSDWKRFLNSLLNNNIEIHFHISMNRGLKDEHLSLIEFNGIQSDAFSNHRSYYDLLRDIIKDYPDAVKIFEVRPEHAIRNIRYVDLLMNRELVRT